MLLDREKELLRIVVREYILRGSPVGSKYLLKKYRIGCSPATIRIILKRLEEKGYLTHLSFSSGRVPTDTGYRFYVRNIIPKLKIKKIPEIESIFSNKDISYILENILKIISEVSLGCGFGVLYSEKETSVVKAEFLSLDKDRLVLIIVLKNGDVFSHIFEPDFNVKKRDIKMINIFLNDFFQGRIKKNKEDVLESGERKLYCVYRNKLNELNNLDYKKIFVYKSKKLLRKREKGVWRLFDIMDNSNYFDDILKRVLREKGVYIYIGRENFLDVLSNFSLMGFSYAPSEKKRIVLGILGFKRMNYDEILSYFKTIQKKFLRIGRTLK